MEIGIEKLLAFSFRVRKREASRDENGMDKSLRY